MIDYFNQLPSGHYPVDGCALLVREWWQQCYQLNDLPLHHDRFVTARDAMRLMHRYQHNGLLQQIDAPQHNCMVVACRGQRWHCGVYSTEQAPGYVIHTLGGQVKIEPLHQFRQRFDAIEFYKLKE